MSKIKFDKRNYRKHNARNKELIAKSLSECGAGRSILLDADNSLIAGNGVYEQAEKLGIPVRVIETDGTELIAVKRTDIGENDEKRKRLAIADNATSDSSEWDVAAITADLSPVEVEEWDIHLPEIELPSSETENESVEEDNFDESTEEIESRVHSGEIWQLGEHRLMCGDSTNAEDIAALMAGEQADLWLTDPPYNVDYAEKEQYKIDLGYGVSKHDVAIANDKMGNEEFREFLKKAFGAAKGVLKAGATFYIWYADTEVYNFRGALLDVGNMKVAETLIWVKNSLCFGRQDYHWQHEPCLYGWKEGAGHKWYSDRSQTTTLNFNKPSRSELHPTMKPLELFGYQMRNSSKQGDIVLDSFGGSGTTIVVAEQLGRKARIMELEPHYCDVIITRWEKMTGKQAQKIQ